MLLEIYYYYSKNNLSLPSLYMGFLDISAVKENSWSGKFPWRRDRLPSPVLLGFLGGSDSKESTCNVGYLSSILGLGRSPGGGHGNPLWCTCLENTHGQKSLEDYSPWDHKEWGMTERLSTAQHIL